MGNLTITPGRALLLLMRHYKDDAAKLAELKKAYFVGSLYDQDLLNPFLSDPVLQDYNITISIHDINNDPTRRYFESHFAKGILDNEIGKLSWTKVNQFLRPLEQMFFNVAPQSIDYPTGERDYKHAKEGKYKGDHPSFIEYSTIISRVEHDYPNLSNHQQNLIKTLFATAFISTLDCEVLGALVPVHIYGQGIFSKESRGVHPKGAAQSSSRTSGKGIMKSTMPLSRDDLLFTNDELGQVRAPDRSVYDQSAAWLDLLTQGKVHPFVNSVSGTVLAILRVCVLLKRKKDLPFEDMQEINNFMRCMICSLIYTSGGHSMIEFVFPMFMQNMKNAMHDIDGFDEITLESFYIDGNEAAFDAALEKAIEYNHQLLKHNAIHQDITSPFYIDGTVPSAMQCSIIRNEIFQMLKSMNLENTLDEKIRNLTVVEDAPKLKPLFYSVSLIDLISQAFNESKETFAHSVSLGGYTLKLDMGEGKRKAVRVGQALQDVYHALLNGESVTSMLEHISKQYDIPEFITKCQIIVEEYEGTRPEAPSTSPSDAPRA